MNATLLDGSRSLELTPRLATQLEAAALIRLAEAAGGHGTVLHKGDLERGTLLLILASRGQPQFTLERLLDPSGHYSWQKSFLDPGSNLAKVSELLARRARFDPDFWAIELDVADPERFVVESLPAG